MVFLDENDNSSKEDTERGIKTGVHATRTADSAKFSSETDNDGAYALSLEPGTYRIHVDVPTGMVPSTHSHYFHDVRISTGPPHPDEFALRNVTEDNDATIHGTVFSDTDGDGKKDAGEPGIQGYAMYVIDLLTSEQRSRTTGSDGSYEFGLVAPTPGSTLVQTGYFPFDHTITSGEFYEYVVRPNTGSRNEFKVGFYPVPPEKQVTLDIDVFHDVDGDGVKDAGEPPIYGENVHVHTYTTNELEAATTGADGKASKTDLMPADFLAQAAPSAGFEATTPVITYPNGVKVLGAKVFDDPLPASTHSITIGLDDTATECPASGINNEKRCYAIKTYVPKTPPSSVNVDLTVGDIGVPYGSGFIQNPMWVHFSNDRFIEAGFLDSHAEESAGCGAHGMLQNKTPIAVSDGDVFSIRVEKSDDSGKKWTVTATHSGGKEA